MSLTEEQRRKLEACNRELLCLQSDFGDAEKKFTRRFANLKTKMNNLYLDIDSKLDGD